MINRSLLLISESSVHRTFTPEWFHEKRKERVWFQPNCLFGLSISVRNGDKSTENKYFNGLVPSLTINGEICWETTFLPYLTISHHPKELSRCSSWRWQKPIHHKNSTKNLIQIYVCTTGEGLRFYSLPMNSIDLRNALQGGPPWPLMGLIFHSQSFYAVHSA